MAHPLVTVTALLLFTLISNKRGKVGNYRYSSHNSSSSSSNNNSNSRETGGLNPGQEERVDR
jgi:hypothetical protein